MNFSIEDSSFKKGTIVEGESPFEKGESGLE
jgi:hypothetical protein